MACTIDGDPRYTFEDAGEKATSMRFWGKLCAEREGEPICRRSRHGAGRWEEQSERGRKAKGRRRGSPPSNFPAPGVSGFPPNPPPPPPPVAALPRAVRIARGGRARGAMPIVAAARASDRTPLAMAHLRSRARDRKDERQKAEKRHSRVRDRDRARRACRVDEERNTLSKGNVLLRRGVGRNNPAIGDVARAQSRRLAQKI